MAMKVPQTSSHNGCKIRSLTVNASEDDADEDGDADGEDDVDELDPFSDLED